MRRIIVPVFVLTALFCLLAASAALAAPEAPKDPVEMKYPDDGNKYAPIMFMHTDKHLGVAGGCATCHHKWDGKAEITGCRVEGCHSDTSREMKREPTSYDSAFHSKDAKMSCVGCHTANLKDNPDFKGPKKCNDCHSKK
ncbi:cytochrome c3 family protein [Paucidesulfovibrio longus]|uniref:cytochrome c3 family protein n=1 Tax=Paucidesulfovibrio longus TaxID=889 RepID=UPI0003B4E8C8|nr:cytochrome c3 family protein [Paucidesulfovibrio longus]